MHVVFYGTYDTHRPRLRVLKRGLVQSGVVVTECHASVWGELEDRSHLRGAHSYLLPGLRWCAALPRLRRLYRSLPSHDAVIVPYLGQADAVVASLLVRKRGVPLIFDPYVSLYGTFIGDRRLAEARSPVAHALRMLDAAAFRAADAVLVDTRPHGELMAAQVGVSFPPSFVVPVGAEPDIFVPQPLPGPAPVRTVLFYGWMIPLHGVETIVRAAAELRSEESVRFVLIGTGQDHAKARALAQELDADGKIEWRDRVPYGGLPAEIARADVCLGIFGTSRKAQAVVPNKVFQALAVGRPVITADTPGMREWFRDGTDCLLVPPGDHRCLSEAVRRLLRERSFQEQLAQNGHRLFLEMFHPAVIGALAREAINSVSGSRVRSGRTDAGGVILPLRRNATGDPRCTTNTTSDGA